MSDWNEAIEAVKAEINGPNSHMEWFDHELIHLLDSLKRPADQDGWMPIESAPTTGEPILLSLPEPINSNDVDGYAPWDAISVVIGWCNDGEWEICFMYEGTADSFGYSSNFFKTFKRDYPTGWMPLPSAPTSEAK